MADIFTFDVFLSHSAKDKAGASEGSIIHIFTLVPQSTRLYAPFPR